MTKSLAGRTNVPDRPQAQLLWVCDAAGATLAAVVSGCGENRRDEMAKPEAVFIYVGTYPSKAAAEADYEVLMSGARA
jgi:hypothetical protein